MEILILIIGGAIVWYLRKIYLQGKPSPLDQIMEIEQHMKNVDNQHNS